MNPRINPHIRNLMPMFMSPTLRYALVKYGAGIVQMSGSIAGNTYARNRYGNYVRARTKPVNPNTLRQQQVRAALTVLTERWADTLTAGQRTAWNLYASNVSMTNKLGESIKLSGFNHYLRSNTIHARLGQTIIDDGPVIFELPETDPTLSITASEATQQISVNFDAGLPWSTEDTAVMQFFMGQPQNAQRNFFAGPWRYMGGVAGIDPGGAASPELETVVFAIAEGQHIWMYARIIRADHRISTKMAVDVLVVA